MFRKAFLILITSTLFCILQAASVSAEVIWPDEQVMPSFLEPAENLDLMTLQDTKSYSAIGTEILHGTGQADWNGWYAACGTDTPGHMVYGPYATDVPAGESIATYELMVDNNTANDELVATVDVYDATTDKVLASKDITRQQFEGTYSFQKFQVPYTNPTGGHSLEFRVYWAGTSYVKVSTVGSVNIELAQETILFSSLQGLINKTKPRIWTYGNDEEGKYNWLNSLNLGYTEVADNWSLLTKYRSYINGIVVFDDSVPDTINLATVKAALSGGIAAGPDLVAKLTSAPYNLPIIEDFRDDFTSKVEVYQYMYDNYWDQLSKRMLIGLKSGYTDIKGNIREYASAVGAAAVWLDPSVEEENEVLVEFLSDMPSGSVYMGWWPDEQQGVTRASEYGISTIASDWAENLTVLGGMSREITVKDTPDKPYLENKIYISLILSDGDNLQYMQHRMKVFWDDSDRGEVPVSWTVSPVALDAMPGVLNYLYETATDNDCLIAGPSGYGYTYPNVWSNQDYLDDFVKLTNDYCERAGLKVITIWNTISGGINVNVGNSFADNAPSLLGLTSQAADNTAIYNNKLPVIGLNANYCYSEDSMINEINNAIRGWDGNSPKFVTIQCNPWEQADFDSFVNVVDYFSENSDIEFVRADNLFQLYREANLLPVDPSSVAAKYEAEPNSFETCLFSHSVGRVDDDGWAADTSLDEEGFMLYGPYIEELPEGTLTAVFKMLVDDNTYDNNAVVTIDVRDNTTGQVLVSEDILRTQFTSQGTYQNFSLQFENTEGHALEFRAYYHDIAYVRIDKVTICIN